MLSMFICKPRRLDTLRGRSYAGPLPGTGPAPTRDSMLLLVRAFVRRLAFGRAGTAATCTVLEDVLVVTVRKSFWASPECQIFPNRLYATRLWGYSQTRVNTALTFLRALPIVLLLRPRLIFFGSSHRLVPWFIRLRRRGWFSDIRLVATNQVHFSDEQARDVARIIVYSRCEVDNHDPAVRGRYVFMPLPADVPFERSKRSPRGRYLFSGGGAHRDFQSLIEAVRDLPVDLVIVTFSVESLGYSGDLPPNVRVIWKVPIERFVEIMAGARMVIVPLHAGRGARGHTTVVQALTLGKPVITTENASVDDYVQNGRQGFLVEPGNVVQYRRAIERLLTEPELEREIRAHVDEMAAACTYAAFAENVAALCSDVLRQSERSTNPS